MPCCATRSTARCSRAAGGRCTRILPRFSKRIFRRSPRRSRNFSPITTAKPETTNWRFASGTSPVNARIAHSANVEAIAHFRKALEALARCPDTAERVSQQIELQLALGIPLIAVRGYAAEETREVFARARALCLQLDNPAEYFQALYGLWGHSWMSGKNDEALSMANEFLSRAEASTDIVPMMVAHRVDGKHVAVDRTIPAIETSISRNPSRSRRSEVSSRCTTATWWSRRRLPCCCCPGICGFSAIPSKRCPAFRKRSHLARELGPALQHCVRALHDFRRASAARRAGGRAVRVPKPASTYRASNGFRSTSFCREFPAVTRSAASDTSRKPGRKSNSASTTCAAMASASCCR